MTNLTCDSCNQGFFLNASRFCVYGMPDVCNPYIANCSKCSGSFLNPVCSYCSYNLVVQNNGKQCLPSDMCLQLPNRNCRNCSLSNVLQCDACKDGYLMYNQTSGICNITTIDSCLMGNNTYKNCSTCRQDNNLFCQTCKNSSHFLHRDLICYDATLNYS